MNILVIGGSGFIGSHLVETLISKNNKVINFDNFNDYYDYNIKINNVLDSLNLKFEIKEKSKMEKLNELKKKVKRNNYELVIGDIRNKTELDEVFRTNKFDCVVLLAAMAGVRPSIEDPLLYEDVNIKGLQNVLECMKETDTKKLIFASSSSVYGNNKKVPFSESDFVDNPISPYASTKKSGELMTHVYHHLYNIDVMALRFFTVYGSRQRPDLAIHKFTKLIMTDQDVPFYGDGTTERDYTYIDDIIDGIIKSIDYLKNNDNVYEILNLGESETISLSLMLKTLEDKIGIKAKLKKMPLQLGDVNRTFADITKAKKLISYNPKTKFDKGIEKFVEWYKRLEMK